MDDNGEQLSLPSQEFNSSGSNLFDDDDELGDLFAVPQKNTPEKKIEENRSDNKAEVSWESIELEEPIVKEPVEDPSLPPSLLENPDKEDEDKPDVVMNDADKTDDDETDPLMDDLLGDLKEEKSENKANDQKPNEPKNVQPDEPKEKEADSSEAPSKKQADEAEAEISPPPKKKQRPEENLGDIVESAPSPPPKKKHLSKEDEEWGDIFEENDKKNSNKDADMNLEEWPEIGNSSPPENEQPPKKKKKNHSIRALDASDEDDDLEDIFASKPEVYKAKMGTEGLDLDAQMSIPKKREQLSPTSSRICPICTYENKAMFLQCEMCGHALSERKAGKPCRKCTFENTLTALSCLVCGTPFDEEKSDESDMVKCPKCTFEQSRENERCEMCRTLLRKSKKRKNLIRCSQCQSENESGLMACDVCHSPLGSLPSRKRKITGKEIPKRNKRRRRRKKRDRSDDEDAEDGNSQGNLEGFVVDDDEVDELEFSEEEEEYDPRNDEEEVDWGNGTAYINGRRLCHFGVDCYNKNPAHLEKFAHPWHRTPYSKLPTK